MLQKKAPRKSEWEKALKEMKSHLSRNEGINNVSAILELSYHNLPPELKACFLFLGLFKEDAVIEAKDLVHLWVAQGLVAQEGLGEEETMEDVATNYLKQLIRRNMVQVKSREYDKVTECQMHDLLRDLSQRKAKEEINMEVVTGDSHHSLHKPRHRVIYSSDSSNNQNQYLRSLFIIDKIDHDTPSYYWESFELLRVLDFGNARLRVLPEAIGALTGLRYIKMRYVGGPSKLPRSWGKLTNLQVLDLLGVDGRSGGNIIIDKVILKMKRLRHLYANINTSTLSKKVSLANMKTLQMSLGFNMLRMSEASELFTHLASLGNLVSLTVRNCFHLANMDGLGALHLITELKLENLSNRLPTKFPPKLSYLTLSVMYLTEDPMPVLERLPELLYLKLERGIYKSGEMVIKRHGFPRLKVLLLEFMDVTHIQVEKCGMLELKHLFIHHCPYFIIENLPEHLKSAIYL